MEMSIVIGELLAALRLPGCPICRLHQQKEILYVQRLLSERVNDGLTLSEFASSRGWCSQHAWLLEATDLLDWGDGQKAAIMYEVLCASVERAFAVYSAEATQERRAQERASLSSRRRDWRQLLDSIRGNPEPSVAGSNEEATAIDHLMERLSGTRCTLCQAMEDIDEMILREVAKDLGRPRVFEPWRTADLVCLPHLRGLLRHAEDSSVRQMLVEDARVKFGHLTKHLKGYMAHYGCTDRNSFSDAEWAAVSRTVAFFAGEPQDVRTNDDIRELREEARRMYAAHRLATGLE
jgi:hypothetical protein